MTITPSTTVRRSAAALATSLLLGACWSDIKDQGQNEAGGEVATPTAYDSAIVPSALPAPAATTPSQPGGSSADTAGADSLRRTSTPPPGGG